MNLTTLKVPGTDALWLLNDHRSRYPATGQYAFLIGDDTDLANVKHQAESSKRNAAAIIKVSFRITIAQWIRQRFKGAGVVESSAGETPADWPDEWPDTETARLFRQIEKLHEWPGEWPDDTVEKGPISLHKDFRGNIKPEVYLGFAKIEQPWHLPAVVKFGGWNECPKPEVHCAFHREWQERYGAQITALSGDVLECAVKNPPTDRKAATILAWEQACYAADVVAQCPYSGSNFAGTLMNSPYWYFWWD
jgi:hypothetical protein